jgi:hypothetical protein
MVPLLETFFGTPAVEYAVITFLCLQYPEIFIPLRQTLFSETVRSHSVPN